VLNAHPVNDARLSRGQLPANGLLTRGAGAVVTPRNFVNQLGLSATLVTGEGTVDGLGRLFEFSVINKPEFTGARVTDIEAKIEAARAALEDSELVFVHFKGPDVAAHDLNPSAKRDFIEKVDAFISTLVDDDVVLAVTGDHTTDSTTGRHTGDAVPGVILARGSRLDQVSRFAESTCPAGALGSLTSTSFLMAMLDHMHVLHNYRGYEDAFIQ
jgi:2,3-bisphosphoglycerate-independent phosphoglycerate mutase